MRPLRLLRRMHAPLVCLAIACIVSVGCVSKRETLSLGEPAEAFRADDGSVLFGYYVQPKIKPDHAGWHWLVIEPDTAKLLMQPVPEGSNQDSPRAVVVDYEGWRANADLVPPLLEPGLTDSNPPVIGDGGLSTLRFAWDHDLRGVRLLDASFAAGPLMRVSPGHETLRIRVVQRDVVWDVLRVVAIGALIAGLIIAGGSADFEFN